MLGSLKRKALLAGLVATLALPAPARAETIETITVQGLSRMSSEAFMHAFGVEEGDPYDPDRIRSRFRALWKLRLFQDLTIESEKTPSGGRLLVLKVQELPMLSSVTYDENSVVTRTQIEDRYREAEIRLKLGKPLDMGVVFRAEAAVRDLLSERGHLDADVSAEVREVTTTSRAVHFTIIPGGKTRIRGIDFTGNAVFSDRKLKGQLKLIEERRWYWPWSAKNLYHPVKWDQDVASVRDAYQRRGHIDVEIRAPVVEVRRSKKSRKALEAASRTPPPEEVPLDAETAAAAEEAAAAALEGLEPRQRKKALKKQEKTRKKAEKRAKQARAKAGKRWVYLSVPINEGPPYTLGEVTFAGNEVFKSELLRRGIPIAEGQILNSSALDSGITRLTRLYEDRGYLYANIVRRLERRSGETVADVEITVDEDEPYYISRIDFQGNSTTHDRVLRRELQLMEGELFSRSRLNASRAKVNQLGYFQVTEEPVIEPLEGENRVRVTFPGEEQGRNEIQIGGGYSGLEGAFFNGVYSTRNFLGRGQVLSAAIQVGGTRNLYQLSFQEPWFLNRPYLLGVNVFRRDLDFGGSLRSTSSGGGVVLGKRLTRSSRINVGYNIEQVTSRNTFSTIDDPTLQSAEATNRISSVTPVFSYSTVNNPYRPSRGKSVTISMQIAGGPLGGDTSFLRPIVNFTAYRKALGRSHFALHAEAGYVREFGGDNLINSGNVEGVPRFQRFWLGGDTLGPRVFETRTITPRRFLVADDDGNIIDTVGNITFGSPDDLLGNNPVPFEVGGDRMYLMQSELVFPFNPQAELALFLDAGDALFNDTRLDFSTLRVAAGIEMRFHLPIFPVPLRLIYGFPVRKLEGDRTSGFTFSIGRSF